MSIPEVGAISVRERLLAWALVLVNVISRRMRRDW